MFKEISFVILYIVMDEEKLIQNIIQIRNSKGLTKRSVAEALKINEASYGRIENRKISLSYSQLASIASFFQMSVIDVIGYPDKYVKAESSEEEPMEAILQIKLKKEKKEQVLKLVFGENNIEILNK
jgi:transcriptional regulator with XRE-family HTH domain